MSTLDAIAAKIIKEQELVIGPLAWELAGKVGGLLIDIRKGDVTIVDQQPTLIVDHLVAQYERLFGPASREVCKDAAATLIKSLPPTDVPASLRI